MKDPIIEELWKIKDRIAKEHDHSIDKLAKTLMTHEKRQKRIVLPPKTKPHT